MSDTLSAQEIWKTVKGTLEGEISISISRANYQTWVKDTEGISFDGRLFVVGTPNVFVQEWWEKRYISLARKTLIKTLIEIRKTLVDPTFSPEDVQLQFQVKDCDAPKTAKAQPTDLFVVGPRQRFDPDYTFETFIKGKENELALAAARAVAEDPGRKWNPLLLISPPGLGKTHLLHAIGYYVFANKRLPVILETAEQFTKEFVTAAVEGKMKDFMDRFLSLTGPVVFLVDDMQSFGEGNKKKTMVAFSQCFSELYANRRQIVLAGDSMPKLAERLISRFRGGLTVEIKPPSLETRLAILKLQAEVRHHVDLDTQILALIAQKTADSDVRVLQGKLNSLVARSKLLGLTPSLEMAEEILNDSIFSSMPGPADLSATVRIIEAVASRFGLTSADLKGLKRDKNTALARHVAIYLLCQNNHYSLQQIGELMGGKNHSTVLHAQLRIKKMISKDHSLQEMVEEIKQKL